MYKFNAANVGGSISVCFTTNIGTYLTKYMHYSTLWHILGSVLSFHRLKAATSNV